MWRAAEETRAWPLVMGEVISSRVVEGRDSDGDRSYHAEVKYVYDHNGVRRTGDRVRRARFSASQRSWVMGTVEKYPVGKNVAVFVSPQDPSLAVLEVGSGSVERIIFGLGAVLILIAIGQIVFLRAKRKRLDPLPDPVSGASSGSGSDPLEGV